MEGASARCMDGNPRGGTRHELSGRIYRGRGNADWYNGNAGGGGWVGDTRRTWTAGASEDSPDVPQVKPLPSLIPKKSHPPVWIPPVGRGAQAQASTEAASVQTEATREGFPVEVPTEEQLWNLPRHLFKDS